MSEHDGLERELARCQVEHCTLITERNNLERRIVHINKRIADIRIERNGLEARARSASRTPEEKSP